MQPINDDFYTTLTEIFRDALDATDGEDFTEPADGLTGYKVYSLRVGEVWLFPYNGEITFPNRDWILFADGNYSEGTEKKDKVAVKWDTVSAIRYRPEDEPVAQPDVKVREYSNPFYVPSGRVA